MLASAAAAGILTACCRCSQLMLPSCSLVLLLQAGDLAIVEYLLQNGASYDKLDSFNRSPLHYSIMFDHPAISKQLLRRWAAAAGTAASPCHLKRASEAKRQLSRSCTTAVLSAVVLTQHAEPSRRCAMFDCINWLYSYTVCSQSLCVSCVCRGANRIAIDANRRTALEMAIAMKGRIADEELFVMLSPDKQP